MMEPLTAAIILACCAAIYWKFLNRKVCQVPAPHTVPILGNIHKIDLAYPHKTFTAWKKQFGDMVKLKVLNKEFLVLSSYETIHEVLVSKGADFAGRIKAYRFGMVSHDFRDIFNMDACPRWNHLRKITHKQLKMYDTGLQRLENINMDIIGDLVKVFRSHKQESFNPKEAIYNAVMTIMALFVIGKKYPINSEEFQLFESSEKLLFDNLNFSGLGVELDVFPWLRYFGNSTYKRLEKFVRLRNRLFDILKKDVLAGMKKEEEGIEGVLHALMRVYQNQTETNTPPDLALNEWHVKTTAFDVIYAGSSTTVASFYGFLNVLLHYPKVQKKLQQEVDEVVGALRQVSLMDREHMPYTRATVLEVLRYSSVVAMGVPHQALKDTTIAGIPIPAGTEIFTNLYSLHHDEDFWDEPFAFHPERFLDKDGGLVSPSNEARRHLMPFGAGTRVCVGEVLAQNRLFLLVATISQMFDVKPGPALVSCDPRSYEPGSIVHQADFELRLYSRNDQLFQADY